MRQAAVFDIRGLLNRYGLPTRMKAELEQVLVDNLKKILSQTRVSLKSASIKTQERRMYTVCRSLVELRELGFMIESPYSLRHKHVQALVDRWVSGAQSAGTIENKLSHLKAFCQWIGKHHLVRPLGEYTDRAANGLMRSYVTTQDKSWEGNGVDPAELIARIAEEHPRVAVQLKLQAAFGLRIEESFSLKILTALKNVDTLRVVDGTKGGRKREVPVRMQLDVLEEAARLVDPVSGSTTPSTYSIARWRSHYNSVMRKYGICKSGLGVTSHGLRHGWMQTLYEEMTGVPAPVRGGEEPDLETYRQAIQEVVLAAGHSKPSKSGAYLSTPSAMARMEKPVVSRERAMEVLGALGGNKAKAARELGISRQRLYRLLEG
ncbi:MULTISPECIES: integrase domain-containing protein [Cupriavidus]|uniref:Transcriptional regulator Fis family n=1 Tax=Cupriavidus taiwanensis TaxID=164546 RepID=A0A7Z7JI57_9BURK|nr:Fis family transcriptional regulator [Cupriavidus necator]NSX13289.1 integrase domain-containing protein [Cupriavidus taiwanensis]SOZ18932.1 Transcriptional regulator Fis family [Cupriavidus taiwanensis]SOZ97085.1 Transcriptional regulator Fis family [Cupriavidus taiwanensis]SPC25873.1 Transcriptional regulator Fis family [Cupriavidus taiwanensis]